MNTNNLCFQFHMTITAIHVHNHLHTHTQLNKNPSQCQKTTLGKGGSEEGGGVRSDSVTPNVANRSNSGKLAPCF